jgi:hypothetical protein
MFKFLNRYKLHFSAHGIGDGLPGAIAAAAVVVVVVVPKANVTMTTTLC